MQQIHTKPRGRYIYAVSAFLLAVMSLCLVAKPTLKSFYPLKHEEIIDKYCTSFDLDRHLVMAIISTESKFDENAVSQKGAKGLMQIREKTAVWCMETFNIEKNDNDIELNINIGCAYLRYLIDKYQGCINTALAAYNAGEGNVSIWLEKQGNESVVLTDIPFGETERYVEKVNQRIKIYKFLY